MNCFRYELMGAGIV